MTVMGPRTRPGTALLAAAHPVAVALTGVLAGAALAAWLTDAAVGGSAPLWISYHQAVTPAYSALVPPLGALALAATVVTALTSRERRLAVGAAACLVVGLVVTVAVNFPMNAEIATWQAADPPADWRQLQDRWLGAHAVRATLAVAGFALLLITRPPASGPTSGHPR